MTVADGRTPELGAERRTLESARLVRGQGQHVADLRLPGLLEAAFTRSPLAHAEIVSVDIGAARALPGVYAVITGADVLRDTDPITTMALSHDPPLPMPLHGLAGDKVRHAGEPVAAIAARTRALAEQAARLVRVEYRELTPVTTIADALDPSSPAIHAGLDGNVIMKRRYDFGDVEGAFAAATHIVRRRLVWPRQTGAPIETFGCVARWDSSDDSVEFWSNHHSYALLSSLGPTLRIGGHRVRAHACDSGGSFGGKFWQPRPMVATALLSRLSGRPVRYVEDRLEHLEAGDNHGEDREYDAELAVDEHGVMTGLRFTVVEDYGAAFMLGPIGISEPLAQVVGPYRIRAVGVDFTAVTTNKTAQAAYRGFGTAAQNFMLERLVDVAADECGTGRVEFRRNNLIDADAFPYRIPTGNVYDSGNYRLALDQALAKSGYEGWRAMQAQARSEGRAVGIGVVTCQERSVQAGTALWLMFDQEPGRGTTCAETVTCRIDAAGRIRIGLHSPSLGTSPETVAATVAAVELGVGLDRVSVSRLTSQLAGPALGPSASRLTVMLSGAVAGAVRALQEQLRPLAAAELAVQASDLEWDRGRAGFASFATDGFVGLDALALRANTGALGLPEGVRSGLECTYTFDHPTATMPKAADDWGVFAPIMGHAVHIPVVEVDLETGLVKFLAYTVVHDCGTIMNPAAVRGQVIGAICQGIGSTFGETLTYGLDGRLIERDLRDFLVLTSMDMPRIDLHHIETPSPFTWNGVKGVGEGGRISAPAAVVSAIEDALKPWNASFFSLPITPERLLDAIDAGRAGAR